MFRQKLQRRKRILFVMPEANLTGSSICVYKLIRYLQNYDAEYLIHVISSKDGILIDRMQHAGVSASVICKQLDHGTRIDKLIKRLSFYIHFGSALISFRPDVIYSNTIYNFGQVVLSKLFGAKTLIHVHEGHNAIGKVRNRLRLTSHFTDKYIAVSNYVRNELLKVVSRPIVVVHNGIELINLESCDRKANKIPVAGIIGTIDRNKCQLVAVKAVEHLIRHNKVHMILKIVGAIADRVYFDEILKYVTTNDLSEYVIFTGIISTTKEIYSPLDFVIVASMDEAFPLVNLEAMAAGKLLIASDTGGNPELVENGITGFLFSVNDHLDLANKIFNLVMNEGLQHRLIMAAKDNIASNFNIEPMHSTLLELISVT